MDSICAILVSRNRKERIEGVIDSLLNQTYPFARIIVVDNNSSDGTSEFLRDLKHDKIQTILLTQNAGHGASITTALKSISLDEFDYFFFAEDDSVMEPDLVKQLLEISKGKAEFDLIGSEGSNYSLGRKQVVKKATSLTVVNFVLFSGLLIKTKVFQRTGFPRTNFFMMCDDLEFSMRVTEAGFKCGVINLDMHKALHFGSNNASRSSIWRAYYQSRNRILLLRYHLSLYTIVDCIIWQLKFLYSAAINPFPLTRIRYRLLGIVHGLIGRDGLTVKPEHFSS